MAHESKSMSNTQDDSRRLPHAIFILVSLAIIAGGLWFLYQSTGPYHPDVSGVEGELYLSTDS